MDKDGIYSKVDKLTVINDAPKSNNARDFRLFFGLITFYGKFVANLATIMAPLYELLQSKTA